MGTQARNIAQILNTDSTITTADIADDAVTGAKIENNPTIAGNLAAGGLTVSGAASIGTAQTGFNAQADNLVIGSGSGAEGMTVYSGSTSSGNIFFADGNGDSDETRGGINYFHNTNSMSLRVDDSPTLTLDSSHNAYFNNAGSGLYLGTTSAAAANLLDDYEEGNWTPALDFGGGSTGIAYSTQSGKYTKIGNVVNFSMRIYLSSKGSSTGHAHLSGFPFAVGGMPTGGVFQLVPARGWLSNNDEPVYIYFTNGGTRMAMYYNDWDGTANSAATHGTFQNNTELELTAFYLT